ncbi:MAG: hypothetical protein J6M21_08385 [Campylobacter sp.]|nr:hypothetical protein [Campylobacter sp.]
MNLNDKENLKITNLRDYDKEPIIIKDYTFYDYMKYSIISAIISVVFFVAVMVSSPSFKVENFRLLPFVLIIFFIRMGHQNNVYFVLKNSVVEYYKENKIYKSLNLNQIGAMAISFDYRWGQHQKITLPMILFLLFWFSGICMMGKFHDGLALLVVVAINLFGTKFFMHLHNGSAGFFGIYDQLVLYGETSDLRMINILITTKDEYQNLKEYFIERLDMDIDEIPRTLSVFSKKIKFRKFNFQPNN